MVQNVGRVHIGNLNKKREKGITLIALIITIIVLLILAAVTITTLTGENGLITKASVATEKIKIEGLKEEIGLALMEEQTKAKTGENLGNQFSYENVWNSLREKDSKLEVTQNVEENSYKILYKGYYFKIDEKNNITYIGEGEKEEQPQEPEETEYTITYHKNDGSEIKEEVIVSIGTETTLDLEKFTRDGYKLEGWYTNAEGTGDKVEKTNSAIEVYAKWEELTTIESVGSTTIGNVTYTDSYEIWNKAQLQDFRNKVNNENNFAGCIIKQKADINLNSENWIPIGNETNYFSGTYDGENHSVKELNVNQTTGYDHGLFGYVLGNENKYSEVSNITVEGSVKGTCNVAGLIGRVNYANVNNCVNRVNVTSIGYSDNDANIKTCSATGGIVGRVGENGANIEDCKNYGIIKGSYAGIGGVIGWIRNGNVNGCENYAEINNKVARTGGIIGAGLTELETGKTLTINSCANYGNIMGNYYVGGIIGASGYITIASSTNNASINATGYIEYYEAEKSSGVGGIIGIISRNGNNSIKDCINNGSVNGIYSRVGGIIGVINKGNIEKCYNNASIKGGYYVGGISGDTGFNYGGIQTTANITKSKNTKDINAEYNVGGITGLLRLTGKIEQSINTGKISATKYDINNEAIVGGIAGSTGPGANILYSYNTGNIESQCRAIGGIVGVINNSNTVIKYCYNIGDITNNSETYYGKTGGIVGMKLEGTSTITVSDCWQLKGCIKKGTDNELISTTEKTETEIKALSWENFTIDSEKNNGYPILTWEAN